MIPRARCTAGGTGAATLLPVRSESSRLVETMASTTFSAAAAPDATAGPLLPAGRARSLDAVAGDKKVAGMETVSPFDTMPISYYKLPESVYSGALLMALGGSIEEYTNFPEAIMTYLIVLPQWILLVCTFAMQFGFAFYIWEESENADACARSTDAQLVLMATAAFSGAILSDVWQTYVMFGWTMRMKTEQHHKAIVVSKEVGVDGVERLRLATGLTKLQKIEFCVLVLLPKFILAGCLFFAGGKYVVGSETNEDLILNCVAMLFVLDIDELLYKAFTPAFCQQVIAQLPPTESTNEVSGVCGLVLLPWVKAGVLLAMVFGMTGMVSCDE